jgi:hypothetical protein
MNDFPWDLTPAQRRQIHEAHADAKTRSAKAAAPVNTDTCRWDTGAVYTGPATCGRPAKATAVDRLRAAPDAKPFPVCGIHARTARSRGYTVEES